MIPLALFAGCAVGWGAGRWWSGHEHGRPILGLLLGVALAGVVVSIAVPTLLLSLTGSVFPQPVRSAEDPVLLAMIVGMQATQLSVVAYALGQRAPLGVEGTELRWFGFAVLLAAASLGSSAAWSWVLHGVGAPADDQAIISLFREAPWATQAMVAVAVALVAPVLEELVFRGYALPVLVERFGVTIGSVVTAVGFAALHLDAPQVMPPILVLAFGLGELRRRAHSVVPGMVAHALNNAFALWLSMG